MKRFNRSDPSMTVGTVRFLFLVQLACEIAQGSGRAKHRRERRFKIMRYRGEEGRAETLGLDGALDPRHVLDEMNALDRERALVDQGLQQPPFR